MAKIKIYELAKELSVESKEVIRRLNKMGVEVKTHMSSISEKDANAVRNSLAKEGKAKPVEDAEGFVPRVKRIPKAVIEREQNAAKAEEDKPATEVAEAVAAADNNTVKDAKSQPAAEQDKTVAEHDAVVADGHFEGENMTEKEMQEHTFKELLKKVVDNGQNYTEKMKSDLKEIIDHGKSPEEICEATLAYFAMHRWY